MADWQTIKAKQKAAATLAGGIVQGLGISKPPIDPLAIVETERPRLLAFGDDFFDRPESGRRTEEPG